MGLARRVAAFALLLPVAGVLLRGAPAYFPVQEAWPWLIVAGPVLLIVAVVLLGQARTGPVGTVDRWARRSRRNSGMASTWQILRTASWLAMRRKAKVYRPSLRELSWWQRLAVPTKAYATPVARVGWLRIWSACEDVSMRTGGPRSGKSGELAGRIVDAPGAVITTTTRTDLVDLTGLCRSKRGPLFIFNPGGVGALASTIVFDPLAGCADPSTATDRAADLIAGGSTAGTDSGEREHWATLARLALASLLHAAALGGAGMRDVLAWVADPDGGKADVRAYLRRSSEPAFRANAEQFLNNNDRTRSSVCSTIMPALGWLTNATACAAAGIGTGVEAGSVAADFDVAALLANKGTVYLLGAEDGQTAPLLCALTGHIARQARTLAALRPSGRLDPPLTLALDEAALIAPVPLDKWTADMGGRNITIHIAVQSRAQLRQRFGENGAAAIANNTATLLVYGGTIDDADLDGYSKLTGEREEQTATYDPDGNVTGFTHRRVPVLSPAQIRALPYCRVLIIRRGLPPIVGKVRMAWRRHDIRQARRAVRWNHRGQRVHATAGQLAGWTATRARQATDTAGPHLDRIAQRFTPIRPPANTRRHESEEGTSDAA